ncbi:MAG: hypothetical protein LRS46_03390 [Desulfurococcales archaeon]|nr:hypothetical protein [Desulfurococcales archaeon]
MGRRRRKKIKRVRRTRKITSLRYFECPVCGQPTLTIDFQKIKEKPGYKKAIVKCGSCGLYLELEVPELLDRIDVYNKIVDMAYEGKLEELQASEASSTTEGDELSEALEETLSEMDEGAEAVEGKNNPSTVREEKEV